MGRNNRDDLIANARLGIKQDAIGDPTKREQLSNYIRIVGPMLEELTALGYDIDTIDDLRHQKQPWTTAVGVLLRWLPKIDDPGVKQSIVRCLSVPWVGSKGAEQLIREFERYAPIVSDPPNPWVGNQLRELSEEEKKSGMLFSLAWAIGNALSIVEVTNCEVQFVELCRNKKYGAARQMLVLGLGRLRSPEAEQTAVELLTDKQVQIHAIGALAKMKSKRALFELEKLLTDRQPAIRKEARKAITRIMR